MTGTASSHAKIRPEFAGQGLTDASGNVTFAFPAGLFSVPPDVVAQIERASGNQPIDYRVTALSATSCTVHVRQSPVLIVLSLSVLGVSAPLAGVIVHLIATIAGG